MSTGWRRCSNCGIEYLKETMVYCKNKGYYCKDCYLILPDLECEPEHPYDEEHPYETEEYEHSQALEDEDDIE